MKIQRLCAEWNIMACVCERRLKFEKGSLPLPSSPYRWMRHNEPHRFSKSFKA